jgi:hypothetical protein
LEESKSRLEECLRDPRATPPTKASATFHLARTMAILDRERGRKLLEELTADPGRMNLLSASDQGAAKQLLRELAGQPLSPGHSGR